MTLFFFEAHTGKYSLLYKGGYDFQSSGKKGWIEIILQKWEEGEGVPKKGKGRF